MCVYIFHFLNSHTFKNAFSSFFISYRSGTVLLVPFFLSLFLDFIFLEKMVFSTGSLPTITATAAFFYQRSKDLSDCQQPSLLAAALTGFMIPLGLE